MHSLPRNLQFLVVREEKQSMEVPIPYMSHDRRRQTYRRQVFFRLLNEAGEVRYRHTSRQ